MIRKVKQEDAVVERRDPESRREKLRKKIYG